MSDIIVDVSSFDEFFDRLERAANGDFKKELTLFLQGLGEEFLRLIQDEIIRRKVMDSRLLLNSFDKGTKGNVWVLKEGPLSLEVGTNVNYAAYVNDGHWTNPKGVKIRFVPGRWEGDRFIYVKGAKTGMILKQKWVEGAHYWESALKILEKLVPNMLEAKVNQWLATYFKDFVR